MSDHFGGIDVPLGPLDERTQVAGDLALGYLLSYLTATINAYALSAWQSRGVAPTRPVIANAYPADPAKTGFVDGKLPALFGWRVDDAGAAYLANDWLVDTSTIQLVLVFEPTANEEVRKRRLPFGNAIRKAAITALENGRHPSWVVPNDTYGGFGATDAEKMLDVAAKGSLIASWAGYLKLDVGRGKQNVLIVRGPTKPAIYDTYEFQIALKERQEIDTSVFDPNLGQQNTIETDDGLVLGVEIDT